MIRVLAIVSTLILMAGEAAAVTKARPTRDGEYGFVVRLDIRDEQGGEGYCSGAAISETLILTSAHCIRYFDDDTGIRAIAAEITVVYQNDDGDEAIAQVDEWAANPQFDDGSEVYDRARSGDDCFFLKEKALHFWSTPVCIERWMQSSYSHRVHDLAIVRISKPMSIAVFPTPSWAYLSPSAFKRWRGSKDGSGFDREAREILSRLGNPWSEAGLGSGYVAVVAGYGRADCLDDGSSGRSTDCVVGERAARYSVKSKHIANMLLSRLEHCIFDKTSSPFLKRNFEVAVGPWCAVAASGGANTEPGDSGSPLILPTRGGAPLLLGIHSGGTSSENRVSSDGYRNVRANQTGLSTGLLENKAFLVPKLDAWGYDIRRIVRQ